MVRRFVPAFFALALLAIPASISHAQGMQASVGIRLDATFGEILTDGNGVTLYTDNKDTMNTPTCTGGCLTAWPPLIIDPTMVASMNAMTSAQMSMMMSGPLGDFTRDDGRVQATWNGLPLYYFVNDKNPGDVNGNGAGQGFGGFSVVSLNSMMMNNGM